MNWKKRVMGKIFPSPQPRLQPKKKPAGEMQQVKRMQTAWQNSTETVKNENPKRQRQTAWQNSAGANKTEKLINLPLIGTDVFVRL